MSDKPVSDEHATTEERFNDLLEASEAASHGGSSKRSTPVAKAPEKTAQKKAPAGQVNSNAMRPDIKPDSKATNKRRKLKRDAKQEELLQSIQGMLIRSETKIVICTVLQISETKLERLLKILKERARDIAIDSDVNEVVGAKIQRIRQIRAECLANAEAAESDMARNAMINTALKCEDMETKLMQDVAIIPRKADEVSHSHYITEQGVDLRKANKEEVARTIQEERQKLMMDLGLM